MKSDSNKDTKNYSILVSFVMWIFSRIGWFLVSFKIHHTDPYKFYHLNISLDTVAEYIQY